MSTYMIRNKPKKISSKEYCRDYRTDGDINPNWMVLSVDTEEEEC